MTDITITQLEDINPERVDGVENPANGFPILMLKAIPAEQPKTAHYSTQEPDVTDAPAEKDVEQESAPSEPDKTEKTSEAGTAEPQAEDKPVEKSAEVLIEEAIAKATKPLVDELRLVKDELAKVKATPIPGGPAITAPPHMRAEREQTDAIAKAAAYERMAESVNEPDLKREYRQRAAAARAAAGLTT